MVLNFWAGWCSSCLQELPALQSQALQLAPDHVEFLFVNFQDTPESVTSYLSQLGFSQPVALDREGELAMKLHVTGLPTTFFVDGRGVLRSIHSGEMSPDQLRGELQALLPEGTLPEQANNPAQQQDNAASTTPSVSASMAPNTLTSSPQAAVPRVDAASTAPHASPSPSPGGQPAPARAESSGAGSTFASPAAPAAGSAPATGQVGAPGTKGAQQPKRALPCDC